MKKFVLLLWMFPVAGISVFAQSSDPWLCLLGKNRYEPEVQAVYDTFNLGISGYNMDYGLEVMLDDSNYVKGLVFNLKKMKEDLPYYATNKTIKADLDVNMGKPDTKRNAGDYYEYGYRNRDYEAVLKCSDKKCSKTYELKFNYIPTSFTTRSSKTATVNNFTTTTNTTNTANNTTTTTSTLNAMDLWMMSVDSLRSHVLQGPAHLTGITTLPAAGTKTITYTGSFKLKDSYANYLDYLDSNTYTYRAVLKKYEPKDFNASQNDFTRIAESLDKVGLARPFNEFTGDAYKSVTVSGDALNLIIYRGTSPTWGMTEELVLWESPSEGVRYIEYRWVK